jgi:hypothetical protein
LFYALFSDGDLSTDTLWQNPLKLTAKEEKIRERSFGDIGVIVIWVDAYADIPVFIKSITAELWGVILTSGEYVNQIAIQESYAHNSLNDKICSVSRARC